MTDHIEWKQSAYKNTCATEEIQKSGVAGEEVIMYKFECVNLFDCNTFPYQV